MNKIPEKVNSIEVICSRYIIDKGRETEIIYDADKEIGNGPISMEIIEESEFVNGFKVVRFKDGQYGYVRGSDNRLMPYHYDIAFNFNEYGFAMVGRNASVTWINKDFNYYKKGGETEDKIIYWKDGRISFKFMEGRESITDFSKGDIPLSRIGKGAHYFLYMGIDGKIKLFRKYKGETNERVFIDAREFDESGCSMAKGSFYDRNKKIILFADGYYVGINELMNMPIENEFDDRLHERATKYLEKSIGRF